MLKKYTPDIFSEKVIHRLEKIINKSFQNKYYEKALAGLNAMAGIKYSYSHEYKNDFIEKMLYSISQKIVSEKPDVKKFSASDTVIFYDGFGVDKRGLAYIYLKALTELDYNIIYITPEKDEQKQPKIISMLKKNKSVIYHIPNKSNYIKTIRYLKQIFNLYNLKAAFFYTTPNDVCGGAAFYDLKGICNRYQINLTDHTFWIGVNSIDYCIEFRKYGASISKHYRGIDCSRLLELPYYPCIDNFDEYSGFPFETKNKKIIFSGGSLYKTMDKNKTFYKIIEHIAEVHKDVIFIYAGRGDSRYIEELCKKYPEKVYFIEERGDLYQVLKHSYMYLNTYPISGALMLQYAAKAECIPVTLKRSWDDDVEGILLNEENLNLTFTEFEDVCNEIDKLITDTSYFMNKKKNLKNSVITEEEFKNRLNNIICNPLSSYDENIETKDTYLFRESYKEFLTENDIVNNVINRKNKSLYISFFDLMIKKIIILLKKHTVMK